MATPVILVTGHEGTAAVTADLLGLLTDHGTATLRSVAPGSVRRADPRPRCHRREQRRRHRASMKSAIHPDHHPRRLPRCPVLRRDQVVLEMIVITMVGRPSGPGERKWDVWGSVARAVTGGHVPVKSILTGAHADPHSYQASPADAAAIVDAELVIYNGGGYDPGSTRCWPAILVSRRSMPTRCSAPWATTTRPTNTSSTTPMSPRRSRQRSPTGWRTSTRPIPGTIERTPPSSAAAPTQSQFPNTRSPPPIPTPRSSRPNPSCTTCWRQPA